MSCKIIHSFEEPDTMATFLVGAQAIAVGDLVQLDTATGLLTLADAATDDALFAGVALGAGTAGQGNYIAVALKAIVEITATADDYIFGQGVIIASKNVIDVSAGSGANMIGWVHEQPLSGASSGTTVASGGTLKVLIDVKSLNVAAGTTKLYEGPAA